MHIRASTLRMVGEMIRQYWLFHQQGVYTNEIDIGDYETREYSDHHLPKGEVGSDNFDLWNESRYRMRVKYAA